MIWAVLPFGSSLMMTQAVRNVSASLGDGGLVFVRDYAQGDLAEDKLSQQSSQRCISTHFYARGDGTRAFYFSEVLIKHARFLGIAQYHSLL